MLCLWVPHMYSVCVWVAIRSSIPPTFQTALQYGEKLCKQNFSRGKGSFYSHTHPHSLSLAFISSAPSHDVALSICSFRSFIRWLVGWFWSDSRKTHTISTVRFMLYVLHISIWLLRSPVTTVPLCIRCACPKDTRQEHTQKRNAEIE